MYRRPAKMVPGSTVSQVPREDGKTEVIFRIALDRPGRCRRRLYRADADMTLGWFNGQPEKIPPLPGWIMQLNSELLASRGPAMDAMHAALNLSAEQIARSSRFNHSLKGYPDSLLGFPAERAYVNGHYDVAVLLGEFGYQKVGKRFKPADSNHEPGIVAPKPGKGDNWICEHEGDVLAGVFDAWRIVVEHVYDGDPHAAARDVKIEQRRALAASKPVSQQDQGDQQPRSQSAVSHAVVGADASAALGHAGVETIEQPASDGAKPEVGDQAPLAQDRVPAKPDRKEKSQKPPQRGKAKFDRFVDDDFLTAKAESTEAILDGHIVCTPGMHLLSAMPKAGKSTLTTAMSLTAGTGISISGFKTPRGPVRALYLCV